MTWMEAYQYCNNIGEDTFLVEVTTEDFHIILKNILKTSTDLPSSYKWWIGATDSFEVQIHIFLAFQFFLKKKKNSIRKELGDGTEQDMYLVLKIGMLTNLMIIQMKIALLCQIMENFKI